VIVNKDDRIIFLGLVGSHDFAGNAGGQSKGFLGLPHQWQNGRSCPRRGDAAESVLSHQSRQCRNPSLVC
jgi:hypothetical protein